MRLSEQKQIIIKTAAAHGGRMTFQQALDLIYPGTYKGARELNSHKFALTRTLERMERDGLIACAPGFIELRPDIQYNYQVPGTELAATGCNTYAEPAQVELKSADNAEITLKLDLAPDNAKITEYSWHTWYNSQGWYIAERVPAADPLAGVRVPPPWD